MRPTWHALCLFAAVVLLAHPCESACSVWFVDAATGADANPGDSASAPFRTLSRAFRSPSDPQTRCLQVNILGAANDVAVGDCRGDTLAAVVLNGMQSDSSLSASVSFLGCHVIATSLSLVSNASLAAIGGSLSLAALSSRSASVAVSALDAALSVENITFFGCAAFGGARALFTVAGAASPHALAPVLVRRSSFDGVRGDLFALSSANVSWEHVVVANVLSQNAPIVTAGSTVAVRDSSFLNCSGELSGGVWATLASSISMRNVTSRFCASGSQGGAIHIDGSSSLAADLCDFVSNSAEEGPAAFADPGGHVTVSSSHFACNAGAESDKHAPAVVVAGGLPVVDVSTEELECLTFCPRGTAKAGPSLCVPCEAGTFNPVVRNNTMSECVPCSEGHYAPHRMATECRPCDADKYADSRGSSSCVACNNALFTSDAGASDCWKVTPFLASMIAVSATLMFFPLGVLRLRHMSCFARSDSTRQYRP